VLAEAPEPHPWRHPRRLDRSPWLAAPRSPDLARRYDQSAASGDDGMQLLVLWTLIEDFGGEATGAALCRRMIAQFPALGRNQVCSVRWIGQVLDELGHCGALQLEHAGNTEVIARVTQDGAVLACEPPASETTAGAA
jgi:hypothetical protein